MLITFSGEWVYDVASVHLVVNIFLKYSGRNRVCQT